MVNLCIKWETVHECGSSTIAVPNENYELFSYFPKRPYEEGEEFSRGHLAIGSAGVNYISKGENKTAQIIFRLDPGHKQGYKEIHINQDIGYIKSGKNVRTRMPVGSNSKNYPHMIKMAPEIKITVLNLDKNMIIQKSTIKLSKSV